jgi:1-acyl-sn-glycerol-3-phosphate acyltransferase
VAYWLLKYIFLGPLLTVIGRPKVEGLEYVPHSGPAILASNHLAVMDSFYLPLVVRRRITFLAKSEYFTGTGFKGWLSRWFFTAVGQVPIDRSSADAAQAALDTAKRVLGEGKLLGMYPEGTRSPDGRLYKGKTGLARLALETGVPVIPVAMIGTNRVNPPDGFLPVRGAGRQPLHRTRRHRRGDLRTDGSLRSGVRRHLCRNTEKRQWRDALGKSTAVSDS